MHVPLSLIRIRKIGDSGIQSIGPVEKSAATTAIVHSVEMLVHSECTASQIVIPRI